MTAQPESILNQLVEQLSEYAKSYTKPDEFTLRRLKNEATMLMKVNAAEGAMIRGMIACLEGDLDECENSMGFQLNSIMILFFFRTTHYLSRTRKKL